MSKNPKYPLNDDILRVTSTDAAVLLQAPASDSFHYQFRDELLKESVEQ